MKTKMRHKILSMLVAVSLVTSVISGTLATVSAADTPPMIGSEAFKPNQPGFNGYRIWDIRDWTPEEDPGAEFLRSEVPLQKRITPYQITQANPQLASDAQVMLMQGDYGNAFVDGMMYNNTFSYHTFNFWQYTDYFSPWHGAATATSPKDLYDWKLEQTDPNGWQKRYFEFGVLNIPNPAYTNAAHKNGVKSIACIYFDQSFRQGQTINELFVQDENGKFPVAEKLIEMAKYFKYDGYFFNAEESVDPKFADSKKRFLARLTEAGLWTQYYDTNSSMNSSKAKWLEDDINGDGIKERIQDSVFVNYGWPGNLDPENSEQENFKFINKYKEELLAKATTQEERDRINKFEFERVFYGVEAKQGEFRGGHPTAASVSELYKTGTKNPRASIALFTPSDYYQRDLPGNIKADGEILNDEAYQWMIAERERMYFSGVLSDPTKTGHQDGFSRPEIGVQDASKWVGVADFTSERSVINGSNFYTNFNVGKGLQYFNDGKVSRDEQWSNITVQDILPSWQWWIEAEENATGEKTKEATASVINPEATKVATAQTLKVDFDYGEKYNTEATKFERIGAYNGGSSLVVAGKLDSENLLRLFKTDLSVTNKSKVDVTYFKPTTDDTSEMKLALIFKDSPEKVEYISIPDTGLKTSSWKTATIDLSKYAGEQIATIALAFNPANGEIANYQMNIGEIKVYDNSIVKPTKPTNFKVDRMFTDDEAIVTWDLDSFDKVEKYEIFATLSNGEKINVGSNYDNIYYIKSLINEKEAVKLELFAIGKDGSRSEPAEIDFDFTNKVSGVSVNSVKKFVKTIPNAQVIGSVTQAKNVGCLDISWTNPITDYKELEITVSMDDSKDKTIFTKTVAKGINSTQVVVPRANGEKYNVAIRTILNDGTKTEAINVTGNVQDIYIAPYDASKVTIEGTKATFWCPDAKDWFKLHATFNGKELAFPSRFANTQECAIRATTYMRTTLPSTDGVLSIVLEDYSGNFSGPTNIVCGGSNTGDAEITLDEKTFPDAALLAAVKEQANNVKELKNISTLDLSNTEVSSLKGISALENLQELYLINCTSLEMIEKDIFSGNSKLETIDVTGCSSIKMLSLNNSSLENVYCDDPTQLKNIAVLDMSSSKFDLSEGTSERIFKDEVEELVKGKDDIIIKSLRKTNVALGMQVQADSTIPNANKIFDGKTQYLDINDLPAECVIKFDNPQEIVGWKLYNDHAQYGLADFELQYSNDGTEWKTLGTAVTGNTKLEVSQDITNVIPATYYKLIAKKHYGVMASIRELELYGYETVTTTYPAGVKFDNQRPKMYYSYPETHNVDQNSGVFDVDTLKEIMTINGTKIEKLKDADFIAKDYDLSKVPSIADMIRITDSNGNVTVNTIDTAKVETYKAEVISFKADGTNCIVLATITVKVVESTEPTEPTEPTVPTPDPIPSGNGNSSGSSGLNSTPQKDTAIDSRSGIEVNVADSVTNVSNPKLEVTELSKKSDVVAKFIKAAKGYNLVAQYEINLFDGTTQITKVEGGKIQVSIPFANIQPKTTYVVLRYNDNGTVTELPATLKNGMITFETDHFSTYAIAVKNAVINKPTIPSTNPQTGDNTPIAPLAVLVTLFAVLATSGIILKKRVKIK